MLWSVARFQLSALRGLVTGIEAPTSSPREGSSRSVDARAIYCRPVLVRIAYDEAVPFVGIACESSDSNCSGRDTALPSSVH